ncbi:MAG: hypothetical protein HY094_06005 [Candidatus Melainabacteria bacterium]|nr:hypothetical protein [Candidatus Melainabacteria bacterium]
MENIRVEIMPEPTPEPFNKSKKNDIKIIEDYLHKQLLHDRGAMFADNLKDRKNFINALVDITGLKDSRSREIAINKFFSDIAKYIHTHHNVTNDELGKVFDKDGDGKLDYRDLIKVFKNVSSPLSKPLPPIHPRRQPPQPIFYEID